VVKGYLESLGIFAIMIESIHAMISFFFIKIKNMLLQMNKSLIEVGFRV
jgi:hypothetical protein